MRWRRGPAGLASPHGGRQLARVGHEVELDDPAVFDREGKNGDRLLARKNDQARVAVDDRRSGEPREAGAACEDAAGDVLGSFDRPTVAAEAGVCTEDDIGVEDFEERLEVAVAASRSFSPSLRSGSSHARR